MTNNIKVTLTYTAIHFVAISIALQSLESVTMATWSGSTV
jgi:hypothetical protein